MQIKPAIAAGSPLFIRDVDTSAENNIHAGVKYLRFIIDQYFKDEPMDAVNKGVFDAPRTQPSAPTRAREYRSRRYRDLGGLGFRRRLRVAKPVGEHGRNQRHHGAPVEAHRPAA